MSTSPLAQSSATAPALTNAHLLGRLLQLAWDYRARCSLILDMQLALLALTVLGLGWTASPSM